MAPTPTGGCVLGGGPWNAIFGFAGGIGFGLGACCCAGGSGCGTCGCCVPRVVTTRCLSLPRSAMPYILLEVPAPTEPRGADGADGGGGGLGRSDPDGANTAWGRDHIVGRRLSAALR